MPVVVVLHSQPP